MRQPLMACALALVGGLGLADHRASAGSARTTAKLTEATPTAAELSGCRESGDYPGSLHAATIPETLIEPAQATRHLSYVCGDVPVALYLFDFGNPTKAEEQLAFF